MVSAEEEASAGIVREDIRVYGAAQTRGLTVAVHAGQGPALVVQKLLRSENESLFNENNMLN